MAHYDQAFFNAHHSPIGAFASFTLGCKGARGGFGIELNKPADQSVFIGVERAEGGSYQALPFFADAEEVPGYYAHDKKAARSFLSAFPDKDITRTFSATEDRWQAGDLTFTLFSPWMPVPDPDAGDEEALKRALMPAIFAELTIDNTQGAQPRKAFFGFKTALPMMKMRRLGATGDAAAYPGVGAGAMQAIACESRRGAYPAIGFSFGHIMLDPDLRNRTFGLGSYGMVVCDVPAGRKKTFTFTLAFYRGGVATTGLRASYYYTRWFDSIEAVVAAAFTSRRAILAETEKTVRRFDPSKLPAPRRFQFALAMRSYYGSTQGLVMDGRPLYVLNEGEYLMINSLDIFLDAAFFELLMNPWTVRNTMELYTRRYMYRDKIRGADAREFPGGIAFTHDMGVMNNFSRPGESVYERAGKDGCFSFASHEELTSWILCSGLYVARTGDRGWFRSQRGVFIDAFNSLCRRDHPDPAERDGIMGFDSCRCKGGSEVTTYDTLGYALGRARGNIYLAVKDWAACAIMAELFKAAGEMDTAREMHAQAMRTADAVVRLQRKDGTLPPLADTPDADECVVPLVEGLVFPWFCGFYYLLGADGPFARLMDVLQAHLRQVLRPGVCLFDDGGWKLSSRHDNTFLSKVYLAQFISRHIFCRRQKMLHAKADAAHMAWLLDEENACHSWSDQFMNGSVYAGRYYPRGVTSILWMLES